MKEGDKLTDLLHKYQDVKDSYAKIKDACADAGLKIVGNDIVKE